MRRMHYDVIVAGVGAMGSAACFHLARRGVRVLGIDAHSIPGAHGSSHGQSRMIRLCYYEHPDYVPLLRRAYELWDELSSLSGTRILFRTGGLYIGAPNSAFVGGARASAMLHQLPHEFLDEAAMRQRFPQFVVPEGYAALFEPNAGFVLPEVTIAAQANLALSFGATLRGHEAMVSWRTTPGGVEVQTTRDTYRADRLVLCPGPWSGRVMADLGVELTVTRQIVGWLWPAEPHRFTAPEFPVWAVENVDGSLEYGFPLATTLPGPVGMKVAHHGRGPSVTPDHITRTVTAADEHEVRTSMRSVLPSADGELMAISTCMYTCTSDNHFIVDLHPASPEVALACGFSGHGFKFSPVIGEALADLAMTGRTRLPIDFLGLSRFAAAETGRDERLARSRAAGQPS